MNYDKSLALKGTRSKVHPEPGDQCSEGSTEREANKRGQVNTEGPLITYENHSQNSVPVTDAPISNFEPQRRNLSKKPSEILAEKEQQ
jgi:hypothetical protein